MTSLLQVTPYYVDTYLELFKTLLCMRWDISSIYFCNSEAFASKLLENLEKRFFAALVLKQSVVWT